MTKREAGRQLVKLIDEIRAEARARGTRMTRREIQEEIDAARRDMKKGRVSARNPRRR